MTNREWLLNKMQNMSDEEFAEVLDLDVKKDCGDCLDTSIICRKCIANWLQQEYKEKITLSKVERIILENIDKDYKWIARDINGCLWVYANKPIWDIDSKAWRNTPFSLCEKDISLFNHLFPFIRWGSSEPYNIEELLKGE